MKPGSTLLSMPSRYRRCAFILSLHSIVQAGCSSFVTGFCVTQYTYTFWAQDR